MNSSSSDSGDDEDELESEIPTAQFDRNGKPRRPEETLDPLKADSKHPVLRRSAILFLGMLFRTAKELQEESPIEEVGYDERNPLGKMRMGGGGSISRRSGLVGIEVRKRAKTVLGYVGSTDEDSLVRHQAGEVLEEMTTY